MIKYCTHIKKIRREMTFIAYWVKDIDLNALCTNTIYAIFIIILFFPKVSGNHLFAKYFYMSTILEHL
jgi:hypothetical protein